MKDMGTNKGVLDGEDQLVGANHIFLFSLIYPSFSKKSFIYISI